MNNMDGLYISELEHLFDILRYINTVFIIINDVMAILYLYILYLSDHVILIHEIVFCTKD